MKFKRGFIGTAALIASLLAGSLHAASAVKEFTITNTGDGSMTISGAGISGNTAEFALTGNTCTSVAVGASCVLTVTFTPNGEAARADASLSFSSNGTNGPTHSITLAGTGGANAVTRVISANAVDVNMATLFGNPTVPANYVLTINAGIQVTASSTAVPALTTGVFPAGSTVKIVNNGYIVGRGGNGGVGATVPYNDGADVNYWGAAGAPGGPALDLKVAAAIDNSSGYVYGGGGGGGGGAGYIRWNKYAILAGGGGGGGGAGGGAGASGGSAVNLGMGGSTNGGTGVSGGAAGGAGGFGGGQDQGLADVGGPGGAGGGYGSPGSSGLPAYYASGSGTQLGYIYTVGAGGAAGAAVVTNGNALTWDGGNDATRVKGLVN